MKKIILLIFLLVASGILFGQKLIGGPGGWGIHGWGMGKSKKRVLKENDNIPGIKEAIHAPLYISGNFLAYFNNNIGASEVFVFDKKDRCNQYIIIPYRKSLSDTLYAFRENNRSYKRINSFQWLFLFKINRRECITDAVELSDKSYYFIDHYK